MNYDFPNDNKEQLVKVPYPKERVAMVYRSIKKQIVILGGERHVTSSDQIITYSLIKKKWKILNIKLPLVCLYS